MPGENYGFGAACETGPAAPELRRRCAWLHHGPGPLGPTEYKFVARSVAPKAGSPQTVLCQWPTRSVIQRHSKSWRCDWKTLDLERPIQVSRPVVQVPAGPVPHLGQNLALRHPVAPQPIRDDAPRLVLEPGQQALEEALGGRGIPPVLHQDVQHHAVLVHRAPEVMELATDADEDLILLRK